MTLFFSFLLNVQISEKSMYDFVYTSSELFLEDHFLLRLLYTINRIKFFTIFML